MKRAQIIVLPEMDRRLGAAADMSRARKLCKEAGLRFRDWVAENTPHSLYTATRLARIGDKSNPASRLQSVRARAAAANRKSRNLKRARKYEEGISKLGRCKIAFAALKPEDKATFSQWMRKEMAA